jgi:hypothetical protein
MYDGLKLESVKRLGKNLGNTFVNIRSNKENYRNNSFHAKTSIP